jgi:hypothetical protein
LTDLSVPARPLLARHDLADLALEGLVRADRYRATTAMRLRAPVADIHAEVDAASERIDQLLFGEAFDVLEDRDGRAWGQARRDGVVGWVDLTVLAPGTLRPTHSVSAVDADLPLNALVTDPSEPDLRLRPIGDFERDPVTVAQRLIGTPHALGARSSIATDCSGLVQQALLACGLSGARRAHEQAQLGHAVDRDDARRGDLVIWLSRVEGQSWTGHSAIMLDQASLIHATGFHGAVVVEALAAADARCLSDGFAPAVFRRVV